jgi:N-acetylmuramoyl-L-alanine amidase
MAKICLDAGHYGKYNQSPANKAYYESDMNWKLHNLLKKYLIQKGFEVIQTRSNQATDLELTARGKKAKGCDLFLSIHSNAVGSGVSESIDYPVAYVPLNGKGDKIGELLAECVADVMGTKQKSRIESKKGSTGLDYYGVIRGATSVGVPGIILEHSFHTNTKMANWLLVDSNLDKMAKAEADVIADYFGVKKTADTGVLYRVQVGAYSVKANAEAMQKKLKAAGYDAIIV